MRASARIVKMATVTHYLSCKKGKPMQWGTQYTVGMQYIVGVSAKRSTHTVDLANMGGGDHYL